MIYKLLEMREERNLRNSQPGWFLTEKKPRLSHSWRSCDIFCWSVAKPSESAQEPYNAKNRSTIFAKIVMRV